MSKGICTIKCLAHQKYCIILKKVQIWRSVSFLINNDEIVQKQNKKNWPEMYCIGLKTGLDHIFPSNLVSYIPSLPQPTQKGMVEFVAVQHLLGAAFLFSVTKWG